MHTFLVTHRPPYTNVNLRAAMRTSLAPYGGVLAGHVHAFYAMNVAAARIDDRLQAVPPKPCSGSHVPCAANLTHPAKVRTPVR